MTLRIGLLGASRIAPHAVIQPAQRRSDVVVTAVAARDPGRAQAYAREHAIADVASDYDSLVRRADVDLVYCALPPAGHLEPCLAALEAGKALLVEKPFAMNAEQAQAIAAAAERAGRPALEAFHYRFHSLFARAMEIVRSGELGPLRRAEGLFEAPISRRPGELRWIAAAGGGGMMDLGCYPLHALRTLVGEEPALRSAKARLEDGVDAEMDVELAFPCGVQAHVRCAMAGEPRAYLGVEGERGSLRFDAFVGPQRGGALTVRTDQGERREAAEGPATYDAQLDHVVQVMAGRAAPLTGGADAVANMALIDAARCAAGMRIG